jgi:hypothetical protein
MNWGNKQVTTHFKAGEFLPSDAGDYIDDPVDFLLRNGQWSMAFKGF